MDRMLLFTAFLVAVLVHPISAGASKWVQHDLKVVLTPENGRIEVEDAIALPEDQVSPSGTTIRFALHGGLNPKSPTPGATLIRERQQRVPLDHGHGPLAQPGEVPLEVYRMTVPAGLATVTLKYQGEIRHQLRQYGEDYARSFRETQGVISGEGVYLSAGSYWYPQLGEHLVTFKLEIRLPGAWNAVSQGERTFHAREGEATRVHWESPEPQDGIFLVAGPWKEYSQPAGPSDVMVFLRAPDENLATKYMDTATRYLTMYGDLIGAYPYRKFALVENFWETGYGMPSFTLLGPKVIRFPFILHSSYPHEILHNWWGNSVYVDDEAGNWCEGLSAYLADHLIKEQEGAGAESRQATLQKYADYVSGAKDFPLRVFRARHSPATEAVGYGKALMFFHMLRLELGDKAFIQGLRTFYRENKFRFAGFEDLRRAFEEASGRNLEPEFTQWVTWIGAPELRVGQAEAKARDEGYVVTALLEQVQPGPLHRVLVPLAVTLDGQDAAYQTTVIMEGRRLNIKLPVPAKPLRLDVDPEFDIFRRLHRNEIPPALSGAFGAERALILLPSTAPSALLKGYRELAEFWRESKSGQLEVRMDTEVDQIPGDRAVWIFGWENRFRPEIEAGLSSYDVGIDETGVTVEGARIDTKDHSLVLTARHPADANLVLTWVATDNPAAFQGLGRKLSHYHKYSYLGFEGPEPTNMAKGRWPVLDSPMTAFFSTNGEESRGPARGKLARRTALATLPPQFSKERMMEIVRFLASPELKGRGLGTPELDQAARYIAEAFRGAGLAPSGDEAGSYFQTWTEHIGNLERGVALKNVVGIIPGEKAEWADQSVVVGAHYDHLGLGWPEAREEDKGKIHLGADDNASGVAVFLELARVLSETLTPDRTVIFVAFDGEDAGRLGSKYYVANEKRFPVEKCIGMVNLDTVGRLQDRKLQVLGVGSADEWVHIFMGASYVTGVPIEPTMDDLGGSDQRSFIEAGVPAVQLFSGPHLDYHRPTDIPDKIDAEGLVKVAAVAKEAVEYLAGRELPLTCALDPERAHGLIGDEGAQGKRKVRLGTVPDYSYTGKGCRITGVAPGSPVERAGLEAGDVILKVDAFPIENLRCLSQALKALDPGTKISLTFERDGEEQTAQVEVEER